VGWFKKLFRGALSWLGKLGSVIKRIFSTVIEWATANPAIATVAGVTYVWLRGRLESRKDKMNPFARTVWEITRWAGDAVVGAMAYALIGQDVLDGAIDGAKEVAKEAAGWAYRGMQQLLVLPIELGLKYLGVPVGQALRDSMPAGSEMLQYGDRAWGVP